MKKIWVLLLSVVLAMSMLLAGCSAEQKDVNQKTTSSVSQQEITLVDQGGTEVRVKVPAKRIVVMQHHSLDILTQLGAQGLVVGTEKNWKKDLGSYMEQVFPGIDKLPTPGDLTNLNVEEIVALKPNVVIVASQANKDAIKKLRDLGIPTIMVSLRSEGAQQEAQNPRLGNADKAYTDGLQWALMTLGKISGKEDRANKIWDFAMESRKIVEDKVDKVPDSERVRVFIANEGNNTYGNDKYVGTQLLRAGAINVAAKDVQGYKPYTFEILLNWNPDVILVQDRYMDVYNSFMNDEKYKELKAVKNGKVILTPYWAKPFGNPDTDSIALGELWLAHIFYPDKIAKSLVEERVHTFYKEFYGIEFTGNIE